MTLGRPGSRRQFEQVDAELGQSEGVAQPMAAAGPARNVVRRGIVGSDMDR
jgi:hypothetical protein